ncbi:MAG: hypothetical protein K0R67_3164 [Paenibacillus sp.]|jgi:hypothetical protein|nr:hypothetical protein [Paenibacillus sp.]
MYGVYAVVIRFEDGHPDLLFVLCRGAGLHAQTGRHADPFIRAGCHRRGAGKRHVVLLKFADTVEVLGYSVIPILAQAIIVSYRYTRLSLRNNMLMEQMIERRVGAQGGSADEKLARIKRKTDEDAAQTDVFAINAQR